MVRFHLKKLNNVEGKKIYKVQSSNSSQLWIIC